MPAGLVADLLTVTGPEPGPDQLNDPRAEVLAGEPGIGRLRKLGWDRPARLAFAALLAAGLELPARYAPPPGASLADLRDELRAALGARSGPARSPSGISVAALRAAAARITGGTVTLLAILGPRACATDPLLPLRLARHVPQLPALAARQLQLLTAPVLPAVTRTEQGAGTLTYSPGTVGVSRTGPLTRLLPTQLALPGPLLLQQLAASQLLYRQHRAPAPPAPRPVSLILDTTPPTYGPAGETLRLAAHLIATTCGPTAASPPWSPSPTRPAPSSWPPPLTWSSCGPASPWTSPPPSCPSPWPPRPRSVSRSFSSPTTTRRRPVRSRPPHAPGHHPPASRDPAPGPASPHHHHLPPKPDPAQLARVITALLTPVSAVQHEGA